MAWTKSARDKAIQSKKKKGIYNQYGYGAKMSDETKMKISWKGKKHSEESKKKMSEKALASSHR